MADARGLALDAPGEAPRPEWLDRVEPAVEAILPRSFYGAIEINIQAGGITTTNVRQSFRRRRKDPDGG